MAAPDLCTNRPFEPLCHRRGVGGGSRRVSCEGRARFWAGRLRRLHSPQRFGCGCEECRTNANACWFRDGESGAVQIIKSNRIHPFFAVRDVGRAALYTPASANSAPHSSEGHRYSGPIKGGAWIDAQHLRKGDRLLNADESWAEVVSVSVERKNLVAYNLTVAQAHTYFVSGEAGADPVWVHNNCFHRQKGSLDNPPAHMRPSEVDSGRKLQADLQSSHPHKQLKPLDDQAGGDFVDNDGKLYDVMGEEGAFKFWGDGSNFKTSIDDHLLKSVDHVVIDLRGASPAQIDEITAHLTEAASRFGTAKINSVIFLTD